MQNKKAAIRIYQVTDGDYVAAETPKQARKHFQSVVDVDADLIFKRVRSLRESELDSLTLWDEDSGRVMTFRRALSLMLLANESFPQMFASIVD